MFKNDVDHGQTEISFIFLMFSGKKALSLTNILRGLLDYLLLFPSTRTSEIFGVSYASFVKNATVYEFT